MRYDLVRKAVEEKSKVKLWTVNGYVMVGVITDFDGDTIKIRCDGDDNIVFLHGISTIRVLPG